MRFGLYLLKILLIFFFFSSVRLEVNNYLDNRTIYNVIGRINGAVETGKV